MDDTTEKSHQLLVEQMKKLGLDEIEVTYSGSGDDGCMNGATSEPEMALQSIDMGEQPAYSHIGGSSTDAYDWQRRYTPRQQSLYELAEEVADSLVWDEHEGWYNNGGAHGSVTFTPDGKYKINHEWDNEDEGYNDE